MPGKCGNCGRAFGALQQGYAWGDEVVCAPCLRELEREAEVAAAAAPVTALDELAAAAGNGPPVAPLATPVIVVQRQSAMPLWSPGLAAVLSFFIPGLGQIYKGQIGQGVCWMIFVGVCFPAAFFTFGLSLILALILWIWCIVSAFRGNPYRRPLP